MSGSGRRAGACTSPRAVALRSPADEALAAVPAAGPLSAGFLSQRVLAPGLRCPLSRGATSCVCLPRSCHEPPDQDSVFDPVRPRRDDLAGHRRGAVRFDPERREGLAPAAPIALDQNLRRTADVALEEARHGVLAGRAQAGRPLVTQPLRYLRHGPPGGGPARPEREKTQG